MSLSQLQAVKDNFKVKDYYFQCGSAVAAKFWIDGIRDRLKSLGQVDAMDLVIFYEKKDKKIKKNINLILQAAQINTTFIPINDEDDMENSINNMENIDNINGFIILGTSNLFIKLIHIASNSNMSPHKYCDFIPTSAKVDASLISIKSTDPLFLIANFLKGHIRTLKEVKKLKKAL